MWQYNNFDEIYHYGIPGMRWGHRKRVPISSPTRNGLRAGTNNINAARAAMEARKRKYLGDGSSDRAFDKAYKSEYNRLTKSGMRKGRAEDRAMKSAMKAAGEVDRRVHSQYKADMKRLKADYKQAKKQGRLDRKQDLRDAYNKVKSSSSFGDKLLYNRATRKRAAKLMVDKKMSEAAANKAAKNAAKRNTAIALAAIGAMSLYEYRKNR